jgi:hypothetical protein
MKRFNKYVKGIDPIADGFSGTKYTDIVNVKNHETIEFIIYKGVGTTGTSTITIEASDDVSGTTTEAVAFTYQTITSGDTESALTKATTAGFTLTAGSSQLYKIMVDSSVVGVTGYNYCRLKAVEVADDPVLGCVLINMVDPNYDQEIQETVIV